MSAFTVRAWHFRAIDRLVWSPTGVCLLVGPNGAGKSTVLAVLRFLRNALLRGVPEAIRFAGGAAALRCLWAPPDADVVVELEVGGLCWRIEIPSDGQTAHPYCGERVTLNGEVLLDVPRLQPDYQLAGVRRPRDAKGHLKILEAVQPHPAIAAFADFVENIRIYDDFSLSGVGRSTIENHEDTYLHPAGLNLIPVLRNWKAAPRAFDQQFEWVIANLRRAFPGLIEDLEFLPTGAAAFYPARAAHPDARLPLHLAAAGVITALLQLAAVAGARPGSVLGVDEMENQLHPHAIRSVLSAIRRRAADQGLTVILTTHSPVLLNEFSRRPEQVFVLEPEAQPTPTALPQLRDPDWLAMFSLGELYNRQKFASPPAPAPRADEEDEP